MPTVQPSLFDGKRCPRCNTFKPRDAFYIKDRRTGRLLSWCKRCMSRACVERYRRDPAAGAAQRRAWAKANPEKAKEIDRRAKERNRESILARAREKGRDPEHQARRRAYKAANAERIKASNAEYRAGRVKERKDYNARYYREHKEQVQAAIKKWSGEHAEHVKVRCKNYKTRNSATIRAKNKVYQSTNRAAIYESQKRTRAKKPELYKALGNAAAARRRARKKGAGVCEKFKHVEIFERDGWICHLCGKPVDPALKRPSPWSASIDHIKPLANGGQHTRVNVACAHLRCNLIKKNVYERTPAA